MPRGQPSVQTFLLGQSTFSMCLTHLPSLQTTGVLSKRKQRWFDLRLKHLWPKINLVYRPFSSLLCHAQVTEYLERLSDVRGLSKMALRRVEHLYYKNDLVYSAMRKLVQQQQAATAEQTSQTQQQGSDQAVEAEDLDEEETEAKQVGQDASLLQAVPFSLLPCIMHPLSCFKCVADLDILSNAHILSHTKHKQS